jgi:transposase
MGKHNQYQEFFIQPQLARHRRYEMLRARFVDGLSIKQIATRFNVSPLSVTSQIRDFKRSVEQGAPMEFFLDLKPGPKGDRKKPEVRKQVIFLRKRGYADTDIVKALEQFGYQVSTSLVDQILREEKLGGLRKRTRQECKRIQEEILSHSVPTVNEPDAVTPLLPKVADVNMVSLVDAKTYSSRVAGIFAFLPFLVLLGFEKVVAQAGLSGSKMIPALSYVLSLLALKLLDKERKSHISDWNFDEVLGLFAGLNILPKITATTDYCYRLVDGEHNRLLAEWIRAVYPILCPQAATAFALDFHAIPHRGEDTGLENHYVPMRGKAIPSIQSFFVRAIDSPLLCYANADIVRAEQDQMPLQFVKYWQDITGLKPDWLYFDSKLTTDSVLEQLRQENIHFITIRRRGQNLLQKIRSRPTSHWTAVVIDTPQRRHQRIRFLDDRVHLRSYSDTCRQITVDGFGREAPTLFLTNNFAVPGKEVVTRYISRNSIENDLGINVNFFHLDCLASEVRLNVTTDVVMTVIAHGCYRWLKQQLKGCEKMEPKQLYRKFIETSGQLTVHGDELIVAFDRRAHNPLLAQALRNQDSLPIPWLQGKHLRFHFT